MILSAISLTAVLGSTAMAADLSQWAVSGYQSASEAGLVSYSVVSNNLKDSITREEFCELAMNLYKKLTNEDLIVPAGSPFVDTDSVAVAQAYNYGIVNGTSDTTFTPNRLVTREEMAKMLVSTLTASEVDFNIADGANTAYISAFDDGTAVSAWAMSSINTALNYGLMTGVTDTTLEPLTATSREQAIVSINRSYEKFAQRTYAIAALPDILLPEQNAKITTKNFEVAWTGSPQAASYRVIIKNAAGDAVLLEDTMSSSIFVSDSVLSRGNYSIIVGAVLRDGSEVYSLPVDFSYNYTSAVPEYTSPYQNLASPVYDIEEPIYVGDIEEIPTDSEKGYTSTNPTIQSIIDMAESFLGTPYVWGGTTPSGFDCSGFVQYIYGKNGYSITRTTYTQWANDGVRVSRNNLKPGDLVYFGSDGSPSHVGLYVGNGQMIHSPRTGDVVKYSTIESGYYDNCYLGALRIIQ